ncbi:MAG: twin-arginine translocase TatA/TatE family subunit, partial [bacterium]
MMPGPKEWFFIFLIILLIFGAKRIPEIMRALGRGLGEFRKARDDFEEALS